MEVNRNDGNGGNDGQTREGYGGTLTSYSFYYLQRVRRVSLTPNLGL